MFNDTTGGQGWALLCAACKYHTDRDAGDEPDGSRNILGCTQSRPIKFAIVLLSCLIPENLETQQPQGQYETHRVQETERVVRTKVKNYTGKYLHVYAFSQPLHSTDSSSVFVNELMWEHLCSNVFTGPDTKANHKEQLLNRNRTANCCLYTHSASV